jgi:hypothetical protein
MAPTLFTPFFDQKTCPQLWARTITKFYDLFYTEGLCQFDAQRDQIISDILTPDNCIAGSSALEYYCPGISASDIDIYSLNEESCKAVFERLRNKRYRVKKHNPFGLIMTRGEHEKPVNLVKFAYYDSFSHVLDSFDWTVTQFALTQDRLLFNPIGVRDFYERKLRVHRLIFYMDVKNRFKKYTQKGFKPTDTCQKQVDKAIAEFTSKRAEIKNRFVVLDRTLSRLSIPGEPSPMPVSEPSTGIASEPSSPVSTYPGRINPFNTEAVEIFPQGENPAQQSNDRDAGYYLQRITNFEQAVSVDLPCDNLFPVQAQDNRELRDLAQQAIRQFRNSARSYARYDMVLTPEDIRLFQEGLSGLDAVSNNRQSNNPPSNNPPSNSPSSNNADVEPSYT